MRRTKQGDYERKVYFGVFGYTVVVVFSEDIEKSISSRYKRIDVSGDSFQAMHCRDSGNYSHVFFKVGDCTAGTIAHEAWHAVRYMLTEYASCGLDNEVVAYHLTFLVDRITEFRNDLIDNEVGVKSKKQEVSSDTNSQGTTTGMPRVQPRFEDSGIEPGEEVRLPSKANRDSHSGRCCP